MNRFQIGEYVVCVSYVEKVQFGTLGQVIAEYNDYANVIFPGNQFDLSVDFLMNKVKFDDIMKNGLTVDQAIDALKEGKKIKFFRRDDSSYIHLDKGLIKLENGLDYFVQSFDDFRLAFNRPSDKFLIHGEEPIKINKNILLNTYVCEECSGTGILDFGFYARKCMRCFIE